MDADLEHICNEVFTLKNKRMLEEQGVKSIKDLSNVKQLIETGVMVGFKEDTKHKLIKVAEWVSCNEGQDTIKSFNEDVFDDFCATETCNKLQVGDDVDANGICNNGVAVSMMDGDMKHVCNISQILPKDRVKLEECGIITIRDLMSIEERDTRRELNGLTQETRQKLTRVSNHLRNANITNVKQELTDDVYYSLCKIDDCYNAAQGYVSNVLGAPFDEANSNLFKDVDEDEDLLNEVIRQCQSDVMTPLLKEKSGHFDHSTFINGAVRHFHKLVGNREQPQRRVIIQGDTQSGKTAAGIGIPQSLCGHLRVPMLCITKGVDESIDLTEKVKDLTLGTRTGRDQVISVSSKKDNMGRNEKKLKIMDILKNSGSLVIADTPAQVNKAIENIELSRERAPGCLYVLVEDEADAMYRTRERKGKLEQALRRLQQKMCMIIHLTATPLPLMIEMVWNGECASGEIDFIRFEPQKNYISAVNDIKPIEMDGKSLYLEQNEITRATRYTVDGVVLGWANEKFLALYDDAVSHSKGVLVLDVSCPRVNVENNIRDKGKGIQNIYLKRGIKVISITFSGSGIFVILPPGLKTNGITSINLRDNEQMLVDYESNGIMCRSPIPKKNWELSLVSATWQKWRNSLIGEVIECMDAIFGLNVPIFIIGYTKMRRGISFRSNNRVPTHIAMSLGRGYSISSVAQTIGRASGNGRDTLHENGFDHVKILTTSSDLAVCQKTCHYMKQISSRMHQGETFEQAMTGTNRAHEDESNFLRHTFRKLGQVPGLREQFEDIVDFEDLPAALSETEEHIREKYWNNNNAQMLLRSLVRLGGRTKEKSWLGRSYIEFDDITDDLDQMEPDYYIPPSNKALRQLLKEFVDYALIKKDGKNWEVPEEKVPWLAMHFIDKSEGKTESNPNENEDNSDDEEDDGDGFSASSGDRAASIGTQSNPICIDTEEKCVLPNTEKSVACVTPPSDSNKKRKLLSSSNDYNCV